ncbi:MAG: PAS domain-containing protein [Spirochaetales bacterium]|nr:PAS domain-containing protein [Spirochaetales bacterium]
MTPLSIPVVVMAAISFYIGLYHLFIYFRRPTNRQDLTFALTCFAVGIYDVLCAGLYNVTTPSEGVVWQRYQLITLAFLDIAFLWFVADYTRQKSKKLVYVFSVIFIGFALFGLIDQTGLAWTNQPLIKQFNLPCGFTITYYEMAFGPVMNAEAYMLILSYFYMLWISIRYYQKGDRRKATLLILAVVLFLAGVAEDTAVATGLYDFIYTIEYSYIGMVLLMAYSLSNELVETSIVKEALKKSERKHRELLTMLPQKIFYKNKDSVYITCNDNFARDLNMTPEQITGKTDFDLFPPELARKYRSDDLTILESGTVHTIEEDYILPDGQKCIIQTVKSPIRNEKGEVIGLVGIFMDITRAKELEERVKQSQKMEALGTLAGGIAHDFNNILGGIIGYTEVAQTHTKPGESAYKYLQEVINLAIRARDLIQQILTFSRKSQESRKPINLTTIVSEAVKLLRSTLPTTIEIRHNFNDTIGMINADITQMHQIVMNLCTNAAHAMEDGGGVLEISLSNVLITEESAKIYHDISPGPYVELIISDTGTGIDSGIIHRIFEPFFTTKEKGKGTGMGLAVVHGIVRDHKGDIFVKSTLGKGTTFTIIIPEIIAEPLKKENVSSKIAPGKEHILFVDDEEMLKDLGKIQLESLGYTVTAMNNGIEAFETFKQSPDSFDLIITDQTMPHMTGIHLAQQVHRIKPSIPIILCTGFSDSITPENVKAKGITVLMFKPISRKHMAEKIREVLDKDSPSGPSYKNKTVSHTITGKQEE